MKQDKHAGMMEVDDAFCRKVYAQVAAIPPGKVCTYGKVGELAGCPGAPREVGLAMSRVPEGSALPAHRVVNKNGTLAPDYAFGSKAQQKQLLESEGVAFFGDGTIGMERHSWPDDAPVEQLRFD